MDDVLPKMLSNIPKFLGYRWARWIVCCVCVLVSLPYFSSAYYPEHDTLAVYQFFSFYYSQWWFSHELPLWMPDTAYGMPVESYVLFSFGPFQYLAMMLGSLFKATNTLTLFSLSLVGDTLFLGLGVYCYSQHVIKSRWIAVICSVAVLLLVQYDRQIYWNFKLLLPVPFALYCVHRGIETFNVSYFLLALVALVSFSFGSLAYMLPIQGYLLLAYGMCLLWFQRRSALFRWGTIKHYMLKALAHLKRPSVLWLSLGCMAILLMCTYTLYRFQAVMSEEMGYMTGGRLEGFRVPINMFLNYGGNNGFEKVVEMFNGIPSCTNSLHDFLAFSGLITLVFVFYSAYMTPKAHAQQALLIVALLIIAFTVTATGIAQLGYHLPGVGMVRHVGYFITLGKLLLLMLAGFGIRGYYYKSA